MSFLTPLFSASRALVLCKLSCVLLLLHVGVQQTHGWTAAKQRHRILVIGSTGFVGSAVTEYLDSLRDHGDLDYITAGRSGAANEYVVDLSSPTAVDDVQRICQEQSPTAVICTVGTLSGNSQDEAGNAAVGKAALGAAGRGEGGMKKKTTVERFVSIGNDARMREFSHSFGPLRAYAKGKEQAETDIRNAFPTGHCIIQPTFIYGGDDVSLQPPRVPSTVGQVAEDILGLYPMQALSNALPGPLGMLLGAPVSRERVAAAAVHAALGLTNEAETALADRDEIIAVAARRPPRLTRSKQSVAALKEQIFRLGDCDASEVCLADAFGLLEEIETLRTRKPATDPILNGRWDFVFDVEADLGTGVVKDVLQGNSPIKPVFDLSDLHMEISEQNSKVQIFVETKVLGQRLPVVLETKLEADAHDPTGTKFAETFQEIHIGGLNLPIPDSWRQSRPLEFSYVDETMLIARGNGGEPHYLKRD